MDNKFIKLEDAAEQLQVSTERLNQLREQGELRAYRDGGSWKFRTEEVEKMASEGVPTHAEDSDLSLDLGDEMSLGDDMNLDDAPSSGKLAADALADTGDLDDEPLELAASDSDELKLAPGSSADLTLELGDDEEASGGREARGQEASEQNEQQTGQEEAAAAEPPADTGSDLDLDDAEAGDGPDSILLSEAELGDSPDRPPSTIIGKGELDEASDLDLAGDLGDEGDSGPYSDVRLADDDGLDLDPGATGELPSISGDSSANFDDANFDDIEELEIDLETESSRILSPEDVAAAQAAGSQQQQKAPASKSDLQLDDDLELVGSDAGLTGLSNVTGSEVDLDTGSGSGSGSGPGLTGLSALEIDDDDEDDDDEDDFVLGDGSDLTLSSSDSGINLAPADSGLSLDDAALELTGSTVGSGLDFGDAVGDTSGLLSDAGAGESFDLTPLAEDEGDEEDDSSQVIALDAFEEQQEADDLLGAGAVAAPAGAQFAGTAVVPRAEAQFSGWVVFFLGLCVMLLSLCGMMAIDVVRSMWSWDQPYSINSTIIDSLSGIFFP